MHTKLKSKVIAKAPMPRRPEYGLSKYEFPLDALNVGGCMEVVVTDYRDISKVRATIIRQCHQRGWPVATRTLEMTIRCYRLPGAL